MVVISCGFNEVGFCVDLNAFVGRAGIDEVCLRVLVLCVLPITE